KIVSMWILARIRNEKFFSLAVLNQRIQELLLSFNRKEFKKVKGNREQMFFDIDKPALKPLPEKDFEFSEKKLARVNIDYHVEFKGHYYSVPYKLAKKQVKLRITEHVLEIFHENQRVASHVLSTKKGSHTTIPDHMPSKHQHYSAWNPERVANWAQTIGPATCELVKRIMDNRAHPEQGFRSSMGIIRLEKKYGKNRLEQACLKAINFQSYSYHNVNSILEGGFDKIPQVEKTRNKSINHGNIRGTTILN
ncbi:IS21 family transposase, partial [Dolichospermum sp. ST_sed1]|nr:IS21 family transposase [Dolichospermum sp. ST_sed1]